MFFSMMLSMYLLTMLVNKFSLLMVYIYFMFMMFFNILLLTEYSFFCSYFLDILSYLMMVLTIYIIFMMKLTMVSSMKLWEYIKNLFLMSMLLACFLMDNLLKMYLFFEASLFPLLILIFLKGASPERFLAGIYLLLFTLMGSFMFIIQMFFFKEMLSVCNSWYMLMFSSNGLIWSLLFMMFLVKIPMYSVHFWLPKAHVEAPVMGSMILAGVMLKLGGYGVLRLINFINMNNFINFQVFVMAVSLLGSLLISFCCMRQIDIKILIAYSSISHLGMILSGIMSMSFWGVYGGLLFMIAHGLCSSGMFYMSNMFYNEINTRNMMLMKGMYHYVPLVIYCWIILLMMNMGVPLSMNFFSEIMVVISLMKFSLMNFMNLMIMLFMSVMYTMVLLMRLYHGDIKNKFTHMLDYTMVYLIFFLHSYLLIMYLLFVDFFMSWVS